MVARLSCACAGGGRDGGRASAGADPRPSPLCSQVLAQLDQCRAYPDFNAYLASIFAGGGDGGDGGVPPAARQAAGLLLKNNLRAAPPGAGDEHGAYIKVRGRKGERGGESGHFLARPRPAPRLAPQSALLQALASPAKPVRTTAGTATAALVAAGGLAGWPELLATLAASLDARAPPAARAGALDALAKVVEDAPDALEVDVAAPGGGAARASGVLVPRLVALLAGGGPAGAGARARAATALAALAGGMPAALADALPGYVAGLLGLMRDPDARPRRAAAAALVALVHLAPDALAPDAATLVALFLAALADPDPDAALEAAEIWPALCEAAPDAPPLRDALPALVPALLANMVYADGDDEVAAAEAAEAAALGGRGAADTRECDLAPFAPGRAARGAGGGGSDDDSDESDGGDRDDGGPGGGGRWTLRKACAASLDALATAFGDDLLPAVVPAVRDALAGGGRAGADWRGAESAVLALGAVADGCAAGLAPHLSEVVALLLPRVDDARPLVRSITCWALSRYGPWIAAAAGAAAGGADAAADAASAPAPSPPPPSPDGAAALDAVLAAVARRVGGDPNPRVQEAACSALATLVESLSPAGVAPRLRPLVDALAAAATVYGRGAARMLYDAAATLADAAGAALGAPPLPDLLLPPLLARWDALPDGDREVLPLLECLTSVAAAVGPGLGPRAAPVAARAVAILAAGVAARAAAGQNVAPSTGGAADRAAAAGPERDFVVAALDLVSGVAEGLGPAVAPLLAGPAAAPLLPALVACCSDADPDVRQSAFALAGDLARGAPRALAAALPALLAAAAARLDPGDDAADGAPAANNACWALGELALQATPADAAAAAAAAADPLAALLLAPAGAAPRSLVENAAITLGRLAWVAPAPLAPGAGRVVGAWCQALRSVRDDVEKEHAFLGLAALLTLNPGAGAGANFAHLAAAAASWRSLRGDVATALPRLFAGYRAALGDAGWAAALSTVSPVVRDKLATLCGV